MTVGEGLKNGIGDLKAKVGGLTEGFETLKSRLWPGGSRARGEGRELKKEVRSLETSSYGLGKEVRNPKASFSELEAEVGKLKGSYSKLKEGSGNLKTNFVALRAGVGGSGQWSAG
jgi:predicted RNase H-like nuclease (RuvC/YqgF family)